MMKLDSVKLQSIAKPVCAFHSQKLSDRQRVVCECCAPEQSTPSSSKQSTKTKEYLQTLLSQPLTNCTEFSNVLTKLLSKQTRFTKTIQESQENLEREVLEFFDEAKYELSKLLDFVYEKEINKVRSNHQQLMDTISKEFHSAEQLNNFYSCLVKKCLPQPVEIAEHMDLANTLNLIKNHQGSLSVAMQTKCDELSRLMKKDQERQSVDDVLKSLDKRIKSMYDYFTETFEIKEYSQPK